MTDERGFGSFETFSDEELDQAEQRVRELFVVNGRGRPSIRLLLAQIDRLRARVTASDPIVTAAIAYIQHTDSRLPDGQEGREWWQERAVDLEGALLRTVQDHMDRELLRRSFAALAALDAAREEAGK